MPPIDPADVDWWKRAVFYQVYPRSFQDSNGDGVGDLEGIIQRLDYLNDGTEQSLGIDAIWLSPIFPSPMKDFGYDVSDYLAVHPLFGDLAALDRLVAECHRRGIRVLLDYVPNHTSDQHPWFLESRSSRGSPKRDWYIWRDARPDGSWPNNWRAVFGGPAWKFDHPTGQYYLHSFLEEQPDLNWRHPEVVAAMHDVLRFWMRRGIDGFRIDVMGMIVKHPDLADNDPNPAWRPGSTDEPKYLWNNNANYPDVYEAVRGIRRVLDEFPARMAVGEVSGTAEQIAHYYGDELLDGLHLAFNFQLIHEREPILTPWTASQIRRIVANAERYLPAGALSCWAFGNHDRGRIVSRHNGDGLGHERARAAAILLLGLRGVPFVYYGEEIGMEDVQIPDERLQDPARFRAVGRDPERTPMPWDGTPGRGFTTGEPWLPYGLPGLHVARQLGDPDSMLSLYRRAIWLRKRTPSLNAGEYRNVGTDPDILAFERHAEGAPSVLVALNCATQAVTLPLERPGVVVLASHLRREGRRASKELEMEPLEAVVIELEA